MDETATDSGRRTTVTAAVGLGLLVLVLVVGFAAKGSGWSAVDLGLDRAARSVRSPSATPLLLALTAAAAEVVGLASLAVGVVVLVLRRRRVEALRLVAMAGASWILAIVVKDVVDRPRPPASLWLLRPDPTGSFPSGHDTTATVIVVVVMMMLAGTGAVRGWLTAAAIVFALAVGVSRVYLGDHYPTDVLGSYLAVAAASLLVRAAFEVAPVHRWVARVVRQPPLHEAPGRHGVPAVSPD